MDISKEVADRGFVTLNRSDFEAIKKVMEYNDRIMDFRYKMKRVEEIRYGFNILNPLVIFSMFFTCGDIIFEKMLLAILFLVLNIASYIIALIKGNCTIHTLITGLLIVLDIRFLILFLANIVLSACIMHLENPLRKELGYPNFSKININYEDSDFIQDLDHGKPNNDLWNK